MTKKRSTTDETRVTPIYWGAAIPMRVIRRFARAVGARFHPEKVILFGSHAAGTPHSDSDVDILVVMPARDKHNQAVRIRRAVAAPFPMDLLVRTPHEIEEGLADGDTFLTEIILKGKVLYEAPASSTRFQRPGTPR